jgi:hypothetical protein
MIQSLLLVEKETNTVDPAVSSCSCSLPLGLLLQVCTELQDVVIRFVPFQHYGVLAAWLKCWKRLRIVRLPHRSYRSL